MITKLGTKTEYQYDKPKLSMLETFDNPNKFRDYVIEHETSEFTSLCPKTGQPDFARVLIKYIPKEVCIETKSLKLYLMAFRNEGSFMETTINRIFNDLLIAAKPKDCVITAVYNARGGIRTTVEVKQGAGLL